MRTSLPGEDGFSIKEMVEIIARALVDQPEAVFVSEVGSARSLIIELKVAKGDLGKIMQARTERRRHEDHRQCRFSQDTKEYSA